MYKAGLGLRLLYGSAGSSKGHIEELRLTGDNHASLTSKLKVCSNGASVDLANELSRGVVNPNTIASASINTPLGVSMDAIGDEGRYVSKSFAVLEGTVLCDIERVHGGRRRQVSAVEAKRDASIGHVGLVAIRRNGDTVRESEVVSDDSGSSGLEVVAVYLVSETRNGTEILEVAVKGISEVQITVFRADN